MFRKIVEEDLETVWRYLDASKAESFYFNKLKEGLKSEEYLIGYFEAGALKGLMYYTVTRALIVHFESKGAFARLDLLKLIKQLKPRYIKGDYKSVAGLYKVLYRTFRSDVVTQVTLMQGVDVEGDEALVCADAETVRQALNKDVQFILEVNRHFGRVNAPINDIQKMVMGEFLEEQRVFVVRDERFIAQGLIEEEGLDYAVIGGIYVAPTWRRKGMGRKLSIALTQRVKARGKTPYLFVRTENGVASELYEKIGYKVVGPYTIVEIEF